MKTNYYLKPVSMETNDYKISPYSFLHGYCDIFALALHDMFGYPMYRFKDKRKYLSIHYFCKPDQTCYADARGITDDYPLFIEEFDDWADDIKGIADVSPDLVRENMLKDHNEHIYKTAVSIIYDHFNGYKKGE